MTIEEEATQIRNRNFVGIKATTLRILQELERDYPSVQLLRAYIKGIDTDLQELYGRGLR